MIQVSDAEGPVGWIADDLGTLSRFVYDNYDDVAGDAILDWYALGAVLPLVLTWAVPLGLFIRWERVP